VIDAGCSEARGIASDARRLREIARGALRTADLGPLPADHGTARSIGAILVPQAGPCALEMRKEDIYIYILVPIGVGRVRV
jgi:hypothetical protein